MSYNLPKYDDIIRIYTTLVTYRNPNSTKKYSIKDCHLFVFVLILIALTVLILLAYTTVELGFPGYELQLVSNKDRMSEFVGVN